LGRKDKILKLIEEYKLTDLLDNSEIIDPYALEERSRRQKYAQFFYEKRYRKGISFRDAKKKWYNRKLFSVHDDKTRGKARMALWFTGFMATKITKGKVR